MSEKVTMGQLAEIIAQSETGRLTRSIIQRVLENPNCVFGNAVLAIDRGRPFDPAKFIGEGWSIVEQDERSLALSEVNIGDIQLVTMLKDGETYVRGEEKLLRLKASGKIRLDAKVFQTFWENNDLIPESWRGKTVFFDGTVLRRPNGDRCVLCLCWNGVKCHWYCYWLEHDWDVRNPSAFLAK